MSHVLSPPNIRSKHTNLCSPLNGSNRRLVHASSHEAAPVADSEDTTFQCNTGSDLLVYEHNRLLASNNSAPGNADHLVTYHNHHRVNDFVFPVHGVNEQTNVSYQAMPRKNIRSVPLACTNCREVKKKCGSGEPCARCLNVGKASTCVRATRKVSVRRTGPPSPQSILDSAAASAHPPPLPPTAQQCADPTTHTPGQTFHASGSHRGPVDYLMGPSLGNVAQSRYYSADHAYPSGTAGGWQGGSIIDSERYWTGLGDILGSHRAEPSTGQYEELFDYNHGAGASGHGGACGGGLRFRPY